MSYRRVTAGRLAVLDSLVAEMAREEIPDQRDVLARVAAFAGRAASNFARTEPREHVVGYLLGLMSNSTGKSIASIAKQYGKDRRGPQRFMGQCDWSVRPILNLLAEDVAGSIGEPDGVLVVQGLTVEKRGTDSVGVDVQRTGLRQRRNCQMSVELAYSSRLGTALLDGRLYLPETWTAAPARRTRAGVPTSTEYQTREALATDLVRQMALLPHGWVANGNRLPGTASLRRQLATIGEQYVLLPPRGLQVRPRARRGAYATLDHAASRIPKRQWHRVNGTDALGDRVDATILCVDVEEDGRPLEHDETLLVVRTYDPYGSMIDVFLTNAPAATPTDELVRVATAHLHVDRYIGRAISHTGLTAYHVRNWIGWHHHHALALVAAWFDQQPPHRN